MATKKTITASDIKTTRSFLNQLIDVLQEDISSSVSRRKYQVFVTGGVGPGVTSSLFQTVYDQDFTLQTANPVFDITVGIASPDSFKNDGVTTNEDGIAYVASTGQDSLTKYLYPSQSLMMREKTDIYGQFAQTLLGDRKKMFAIPADLNAAAGTIDDIDAAMFIAFKRLFSRDQIKRETFAMKFFQSASYVDTTFTTGGGKGDGPPASPANGITNLYRTSTSGSTIFTDIGSSTSRYFAVGGQFGYLVDASKTSKAVGIVYYDSGIAVLDIEKVTSGSQFLSGTISAMHPLGQVTLGATGTGPAKLVPDFLVSGSIDNIVDHFCYSRFGNGTLTAITFQNVTNINSSLVFCRALPDEFNYSSNPTYIESNGQLTIYDPSVNEDTQEVFSYVTTIGLYDDLGGLLAVAKLSRPVEKSAGRDLTFRVRLDF
jgi:hypothetical protein